MTNPDRDVVKSQESDDSDCEIAQDRHHARAGLSADLGTIFVVGHIADPMASIFDAPMVPNQGHQSLGGRLARRKAGHDVGRLMTDLTGRYHLGDSLDLGHLTAVGEEHVIVEPGRDPDGTFFDATVFLIQCSHLRGEKTLTPRVF